MLPGRYRRVEIKIQSSVRFEVFDFSFYNRTRFAGLENDLPNCYCNSLLQVCGLIMWFYRLFGQVHFLQVYGGC
jgi:PAB-dependent poly(A)-specific ribonuclease subunit 2